jgi:pyruvate dehydrogenase E2 component (dihydrolipoamide acetyltransferase)
MEFEAIEDGKITSLLVSEGTTNIPVNQAIAELTTEDDAHLEKNQNIKANKPSNQESTKKPVRTFSSISEMPSEVNKSKISLGTNRIRISPLAKKLASHHNIDTSNILGSGPHGRIVKKDITKQFNYGQGSDATHSTISSDDESLKLQHKNSANNLKEIYHDREHKPIALSAVRKIVANRLTDSKKNIPHFYLRQSIKLDNLLEIRLKLNEEFQNSSTRISINDFIIKAVAKSLQDNPKCNTIWANDHLMQLKSSDISVAVAIEDGLITPVIRDAEKKNLAEISLEMKEKARRAKEKKLMPEEYTGGSCSISNLGMMGIESFDAVINPPQASILAVGSSVKKPLIAKNGDIYVGHTMSISLSADHRVIDGAVGATFVASITEYLSNPLRLML